MKLKRKHNAPNKVHFFYSPLLSFFLSPLEILCLGIILRASSSIKKCEVVFTVANLKRPLFRNNFYDPSFFFFSNNSSNNFSSALLRWQKRKRELFFFQKTAPTRARQRPQERDKRAQQLVDSLRQYTEQPPLLLGELFKPLLRKLEAPLLPFSFKPTSKTEKKRGRESPKKKKIKKKKNTKFRL